MFCTAMTHLRTTFSSFDKLRLKLPIFFFFWCIYNLLSQNDKIMLPHFSNRWVLTLINQRYRVLLTARIKASYGSRLHACSSTICQLQHAQHELTIWLLCIFLRFVFAYSHACEAFYLTVWLHLKICYENMYV